MKIPEAISKIEKSIDPTSGKSEIKNRNKLVSVLKELEVKNFTTEQHLLLEEQLTLLFGEKDLDYKRLKESKRAFYSFLGEKLRLTYAGYWKVFDAFLGSAVGFIGLAFAMSFLESYSNYIIAPFILMAIGFVIGSIADFSLEKQGRTIRTWP